MQNRQAARSPGCLSVDCAPCATVATRVRLPFPHSDTTSILANWRSKTDLVWPAVVAASQKWAHHEKVSTSRILVCSCPRRHAFRDRAIGFCRNGRRGNTQGHARSPDPHSRRCLRQSQAGCARCETVQAGSRGLDSHMRKRDLPRQPLSGPRSKGGTASIAVSARRPN